MLGIDKELASVAQQHPTDERLRALKRIIPSSTIRSILQKTRQTASCSRLPKWFMVWFVIGMGLYATDCYRQVFRWLQRFRNSSVPNRSTLCEARRRLGVAPLWALTKRIVKLLAVPTTPGAYYDCWRLMAIDGFVLDLADTESNEKVFGRPKCGRGRAAFPQCRLLALCEVGTHVLWQCLIKPIRRAEITMARSLLRFLQPDMLLLWDRGFLSYDNVKDVKDRQAQLLARIKKNLVFSKIRSFSDNSYLAKLYRSSQHRRQDRDGILVRVIDYTFHDPGRPGSGEVHRLLTTLLDAEQHPAQDLIALYHERWEEELAIDELKTHQRERPVLRSQKPAGVVQEIYGLLLAHYVVRKLMFEAAATKQLPPRQMSFTGALKILRCRLPECPSSSRGLRRWYEELVQEISEEVLPPRRNRINPRVIKKKMSNWKKKGPQHKHNPQPTMKFRDAVEVNC